MQNLSESQNQNKALRAKEAANILGISTSTLWRWSKEGRLTVRKIGPRVSIWSRKEVEALLNEPVAAS